jgi:hypothetical protein
MTTHHSAAYAGIVKAMKKNNQGGKKMATTAVRHANKLYKGAGGKVAMMRAMARYMANHPGSKKAQKMVGAVAQKY